MAKVNVHHADRHDSIRASRIFETSGGREQRTGQGSRQQGKQILGNSACAEAAGKARATGASASAVYIEIDGKRFTIDATLLADSTDGDKHRTTLTRRMSGKSVVVLLLGLGAAYSRLDEAYNALAAYIKRLCGLPVSSKRQPNVSRRQASARRGKAKK